MTASAGKPYLKTAAAIVVAAALWFVMFSPWTAPHVDFWTMMTFSALTLTVLAKCFRPDILKWPGMKWSDIVLGAGIAAGLWGIFFAGDRISSALFGFARPQVELIYGIKEGISPWLLSALLLLLIGPAEELFWRGYVQSTLSAEWNPDKGAAVTLAAYTLVHLPSLNFMLIAAAFTAGLVWGLLYRFWPERLWALVISHALWDAAVFVWFPV